jgi:ribosomal protein S18 acetylase RimI-like enzyme
MNTHSTTIHPSTLASIRSAELADLVPLSTTLADAFKDDPVFEWCFPDPARRARVLPHLFELFARHVLPYGASHITDDGTATALWVPAGQPPIADQHADEFGAAIAELVADDMDRVGAIMALLDEHHPTEPNGFLWFIGVQTDAQGCGLGSQLLGTTLHACDRAGTPAYLDATSPNNRRLYERHGFVVTAERSTAGSPPLWAMWRKPGAASVSQ